MRGSLNAVNPMNANPRKRPYVFPFYEIDPERGQSLESDRLNQNAREIPTGVFWIYAALTDQYLKDLSSVISIGADIVFRDDLERANIVKEWWFSMTAYPLTCDLCDLLNTIKSTTKDLKNLRSLQEKSVRDETRERWNDDDSNLLPDVTAFDNSPNDEDYCTALYLWTLYALDAIEDSLEDSFEGFRRGTRKSAIFGLKGIVVAIAGELVNAVISNIAQNNVFTDENAKSLACSAKSRLQGRALTRANFQDAFKFSETDFTRNALRNTLDENAQSVDAYLAFLDIWQQVKDTGIRECPCDPLTYYVIASTVRDLSTNELYTFGSTSYFDWKPLVPEFDGRVYRVTPFIPEAIPSFSGGFGCANSAPSVRLRAVNFETVVSQVLSYNAGSCAGNGHGTFDTIQNSQVNYLTAGYVDVVFERRV